MEVNLNIISPFKIGVKYTLVDLLWEHVVFLSNIHSSASVVKQLSWLMVLMHWSYVRDGTLCKCIVLFIIGDFNSLFHLFKPFPFLLINILVDNLRYPQRFVQFIKYPLKSNSSLSKFHFLSSCHSMSQLMFWLNRPGGTT